MKKELQRWFPIEKTMLKGTSKVVESKNICNFAPLIEVFMQDWFEKEEGTEHVPPINIQRCRWVYGRTNSTTPTQYSLTILNEY